MRGSIPNSIHGSDGNLRAVHVFDLLVPETGAICIMDRRYVNLAPASGRRLLCNRAKSNTGFHRVYSAKMDRSAGIICDQTIAVNGFYTKQETVFLPSAMLGNGSSYIRGFCVG